MRVANFAVTLSLWALSLVCLHHPSRADYDPYVLPNEGLYSRRLNSLPLSIGVDSMGDRFIPLIAQNSSLPAFGWTKFFTADHNQTSLSVGVYQGENETASANRFLGRVIFDGHRPLPAGSLSFPLTILIDRQGLLQFNAESKELGAGTTLIVFLKDIDHEPQAVECQPMATINERGKEPTEVEETIFAEKIVAAAEGDEEGPATPTRANNEPTTAPEPQAMNESVSAEWSETRSTPEVERVSGELWGANEWRLLSCVLLVVAAAEGIALVLVVSKRWIFYPHGSFHPGAADARSIDGSYSLHSVRDEMMLADINPFKLVRG